MNKAFVNTKKINSYAFRGLDGLSREFAYAMA